MTKIINLIGAPGAGKSTMALDLVSNLSKRGINVELVTEYAKDLVWSERIKELQDQDYVFAKQHKRISRLQGKVDFIVTDSPILLSAMYPDFVGCNFDKETLDSFQRFVLDCNNQYDNEYYFVNRTIPYHPVGRVQTEEESDAIALKIKRWINRKAGEVFQEVCTGDVSSILNQLDLDYVDQRQS
jgi:RecA/RadA recombinase